MNNKEFEEYWRTNKERLLSEDAEYKELKNSYRMTSGADWLLYAIPVVAGLAFMNYCNVSRELLKWLLSAVVTVVCFVLCVFVKSLITSAPSLDDIEKRVKQQCRERLVKQ